MKNLLLLKHLWFKNALALLLGGLFSLGLMVSGMSNPKKVLDFLDITGNWNPSLAFVMAGAIVVAFIPFQYARKTPKTFFNTPIDLPTARDIDSTLIGGALLFGIGWGIAGICPAPALTLIGLGYYQALYFIIALFLGMFLHANTIGRSSTIGKN